MLNHQCTAFLHTNQRCKNDCVSNNNDLCYVHNKQKDAKFQQSFCFMEKAEGQNIYGPTSYDIWYSAEHKKIIFLLGEIHTPIISQEGEGSGFERLISSLSVNIAQYMSTLFQLCNDSNKLYFWDLFLEKHHKIKSKNQKNGLSLVEIKFKDYFQRIEHKNGHHDANIRAHYIDIRSYVRWLPYQLAYTQLIERSWEFTRKNKRINVSDLIKNPALPYLFPSLSIHLKDDEIFELFNVHDKKENVRKASFVVKEIDRLFKPWITLKHILQEKLEQIRSQILELYRKLEDLLSRSFNLQDFEKNGEIQFNGSNYEDFVDLLEDILYEIKNANSKIVDLYVLARIFHTFQNSPKETTKNNIIYVGEEHKQNIAQFLSTSMNFSSLFSTESSKSNYVTVPALNIFQKQLL